MKVANIGIISIVGLLLTTAGIVAPITWDWYKSRSSIELHHIANVKLIDSSELSKKIQLSYDGHLTPKLSRHTFSLINAGRTPILKKDLVQPLIIKFPNDVEVLEIIEDAKSPKDIDLEYNIGSDKRSVSISFSLLNAGDQSQFGVLLAGYATDYSAKSRIVGIRELKIIERVAEFREVKRKIPWSVYFVGVITAVISFVLIGGGIPAVYEERKFKSLIAENKFVVPFFNSKEEYAYFIRTTFSRKSDSRIKSLLRYVDTILSDGNIDALRHEKVTQAIIRYANNMNEIPFFIVILLLCGIGWLYVISSIFR